MICPNCGRRNSAGATFCSRCRQRLPLATKLNGNQRRTVMVEPRGGGGSGAIVLGVALLAGFLFIGGAAAIYLSNPSGSAKPTDIAFASGSPTLPPFVQPTATPTPSPTFILLPSESPTTSPSFTPLPTATSSIQPTARPSDAPQTPAPMKAKFTFNFLNGFKVQFSDQSKGAPTQWLWDFGDPSSASNTDNVPNPKHTFSGYGEYTVKLIVTGPGGTDTTTRTVTFVAPTPTPTPSPSATPGPTDSPSPSPATAPTILPAATETPTPATP